MEHLFNATTNSSSSSSSSNHSHSFSEPTTPSEATETFNTVVYGLVSVTVVSLLSLGGAVIGPLLASDTKHRWLHFFLAMAVSTLSSDAILHIIPQVLGVHDHSSHGNENGTGHGHSHSHADHHHHHHGEDEEDENTWLTITPARRNLLRLSVIVLSIYTLYFVEFFLFYRKTHLHYCASPKSETGVCSTSSSCSSNSSSSIEKVDDDENGNKTNNNNGKDERRRVERKEAGHELISLRRQNPTSDGSGDAEEGGGGDICGLKPRALIILFGDGLHNLVDGIAIGASFMSSPKLGFITTIAVICHELPHEIGDLAVLVDSGLSMCTALWLNLLSALTAYIGLLIAFVAGDDKDVETVLLAITAGMFLYVAWVDMLSHLKHDSLMADHWIVTSLLQITGFAVGFVLIFSLGWFEHIFIFGAD